MPTLDLGEYKEAVLVSGGYITLYYGFIIWHLIVKMKVLSDVKKAKGKLTPGFGHPRNLPEVQADPRFIRADRTVLNMLEQMPPFLAGFWVYALFVSPRAAANAGLIYTLGRALYPFFYYRPSLLLPIVTFPNYAVITYFWIGTIWQVLTA